MRAVVQQELLIDCKEVLEKFLAKSPNDVELRFLFSVIISFFEYLYDKLILTCNYGLPQHDWFRVQVDAIYFKYKIVQPFLKRIGELVDMDKLDKAIFSENLLIKSGLNSIADNANIELRKYFPAYLHCSYHLEKLDKIKSDLVTSKCQGYHTWEEIRKRAMENNKTFLDLLGRSVKLRLHKVDPRLTEVCITLAELFLTIENGISEYEADRISIELEHDDVYRNLPEAQSIPASDEVDEGALTIIERNGKENSK